MLKIKSPSLKIPTDIEHPLLNKLVSLYNTETRSPLFPKNFETLFPHLKEFFTTGLVPEALKEQFTTKNMYSINNYYLFELRYDFIKEYGFSLLSEKLVNVLASQLENQQVLEIGAGTGFLAKHLMDRHIEITPVDIQAESESSYGFHTKHTTIINAKGTHYLSKKAKQQFDSIILAWPDYNTDFAARIVDKIKPGQTLYYMGEGAGGCTGNDRFFNLLDTRATLNNDLTEALQDEALIWPGLHDNWHVYEF